MASSVYKGGRSTIPVVLSSTQANCTVAISTLSGYVAGSSNITITVNAGVYLYSTNSANAGLTISGGTTGDTITVVNNGYIMGLGGNGGTGVALPTVGGSAIKLALTAGQTPTVVVTNGASAYIGGGGGGGGGSYGQTPSGGGGGGAGGGIGGYNLSTNGGLPGQSGGNPASFVYEGGCGGRIFTGLGTGIGTGGSYSGTPPYVLAFGGKAGGGGGTWNSTAGGGGGGWGGQGASGLFVTSGITYPISGGNGGTTSSGGPTNVAGGTTTYQIGAAGGKSIDFNGFSCTVTGTTANIYGTYS
jgi:hypothetical protein